MLVVAACGAVAAVVRVLLQAVDAVVRGEVGAVACEACGAAVILFHQNHLFAPVARDVAHEGRTCAGGSMSGPAAFLRELNQTGFATHRGHHQIGAPSAAARRGEFLAQQVAVPPGALEAGGDAPLRARLARGIALAVVDVVIGEAVELVALVVRVDIHAGTAAHVIDAGQVPFLDALAGGGVVDELSQQGALLDGIEFHAGAVWVDVAEDETVAVTDAGALEPTRDGVHAVAALNHLVATIAIDIGHAQHVELSGPRALVVAAPCRALMPVRGLAASPVEIPREDVVMVCLVVVAVQAFHHQRRVDAIEVADGEMAVHGGIAVAHVVAAVVARVAVAAVGHLAVVEFAARQLGARSTVDDGYVERAVALRLRAVVHDAVAIDIGDSAAFGIQAPCLVGFVPEAGAVA